MTLKMYKNVLNDNYTGLFQYVGSTWLYHVLNERDSQNHNNKNINFIWVLLDYQWDLKSLDELDLFKLLNNKTFHALKNKPNCYFVLDASLEGFGPKRVPFIEAMYKSAEKWGISPKKLILATSNLNEPKNHLAYRMEHGITKDNNAIKIFVSNHFQYQTGQNIRAIYPDNIPDSTQYFKNTKWPAWWWKKVNNMVNRDYQEDKYFISFSRVSRFHRTLSHFLISQRGLDKYGLISQNILEAGDGHGNIKDLPNIQEYCNKWDLNQFQFKNWQHRLPLTIDTDNFNYNYGPDQNIEIYNKALFEVVNETAAEDYDQTELFYSEKTFKPMVNLMPFVIFGQRNANMKLKELGFKIYEEIFDYSFDSEPDIKKRITMIHDQVEALCNKLNKMSREEKIEWRFALKEKLLYNCKKVTYEHNDVDQLNKLLFSIYKEI